MIVFRIHCDFSRGIGRVRMKRFRQRCSECDDDSEQYTGLCPRYQVEFTIERVLFNVVQRCYEKRRDEEIEYYIIPVTDIPPGRPGRGAPHRKDLCEACRHDRCQETYKKLVAKYESVSLSVSPVK